MNVPVQWVGVVGHLHDRILSLGRPAMTNLVLFQPKLREAPPDIKRPEPRNAHDIELVEDMENLALIMEIKQRAFVLSSRIGKQETTLLLAEIAGSL